jgi:hypothetical protein
MTEQVTPERLKQLLSIEHFVKHTLLTDPNNLIKSGHRITLEHMVNKEQSWEQSPA